MGLMKLLDKALASYQKHLPEIMEFAEKVEDRHQAIEEYKFELHALSDKDLIAIVRSNENYYKKKVALEILKERGYEQDADNVWRKHM